MLPEEKMPEAEVSLRLAFFLIKNGFTSNDVEVAIDGAQVKTSDKVHFPISDFLTFEGWHKVKESGVWQGDYANSRFTQKVCIHSRPGKGDVVAQLKSGKRLIVESKKGTLAKSKSSQEYRLLREALGQILTVEDVCEGDVFAVAVPDSPKFQELAGRWRSSPLIDKCGIQILTVARFGHVDGLKTDQF